MIATESAKCGPYACNGVLQTFAITFTFHAAAHMEVRVKHTGTSVVTELAQPADFTVDVSSKTITTTVAYSADYKLYILRATPATQEVDLQEGGPFLPEATEQALDRLALEVAEVREQLSRAILLGEATDTVAFPFPEPEEDTFLR